MRSTRRWIEEPLDAASTLAAVTILLGADPARLGGAELVEQIRLSERALSALYTVQARLLAAFGRPGVAADVHSLLGADDLSSPPTPGELTALKAAAEDAAAEVAAALRLSTFAARTRVATAIVLVDELPATLTALSQGLIHRGHVYALLDATQHQRHLRPWGVYL